MFNLQCEIKAELRKGAALRQLVRSTPLRTQLYFSLFSKWKYREAESRDSDGEMETKPVGRLLMKMLGGVKCR